MPGRGGGGGGGMFGMEVVVVGWACWLDIFPSVRQSIRSANYVLFFLVMSVW